MDQRVITILGVVRLSTNAEFIAKAPGCGLKAKAVFNPINILASGLIEMVVRLTTMFAITQIVVKRSKEH